MNRIKMIVDASDIAEQRNQKESSFGAMTYGNRLGGLQAHQIGANAESAVASYLGGVMDSQIFDNHGDDGIDLIVDGLKVGVKATTYGNNPYLRVEQHHFNASVDRYVLCYVNKANPKEVEIVGFATSEKVKAAPVKQFVYGGPHNFVLTEQELQDMAEWK